MTQRFEIPLKYPLIAGIASFSIPGAGQAFCGRVPRGLGWFAAALVLGVAARAAGSWRALLLLPALGLHGAAAWDAYRCGLERARREFESEKPAPPPPEQPPVSSAVRWLAGLTAGWLLPNSAALALMAALFFFAVPFALVCGFIAHACWSRGQEALALAKGSRLRTVTNGWTGTKTLVPLRHGLGGGISLGLAGVFGWLLMFAAVSKFGELTRKGNEGAAKGGLGSIRSALSIYYGDLEGQYPSDLAALTVGGKYLANLPKAKAPHYHRDSSAVRYGKAADDAGGWLFNNITGDADRGTVLINCTHTDTRGSVWTVY